MNQKEFLHIEKDQVHQIFPGLEEFSHLYPGYPYQFVGSLWVIAEDLYGFYMAGLHMNDILIIHRGILVLRDVSMVYWLILIEIFKLAHFFLFVGVISQ